MDAKAVTRGEKRRDEVVGVMSASERVSSCTGARSRFPTDSQGLRFPGASKTGSLCMLTWINNMFVPRRGLSHVISCYLGIMRNPEMENVLSASHPDLKSMNL